MSLAEASVWWVLLFAGYLALVSPLSGGELILGTLLSVIAGCAAVLARRASGSSFTMSWRWFGALIWVPAAVLADCLFLVRLLWPPWPRRGNRQGTLRTLRQQTKGESWQAWGGLVLSLSPGSFVVDSGGRPPSLLVHVLREQPSRLERWVQR